MGYGERVRNSSSVAELETKPDWGRHWDPSDGMNLEEQPTRQYGSLQIILLCKGRPKINITLTPVLEILAYS